MPLNSKEAMELLKIIADKENVKVAFHSSLRGAAIAGGAACVGSLFLGRPGLVLGAVVGGLTALSTGENYRSLPDILMNDLTDAERREITRRVNRIIEDLEITDLRSLTTLAATGSVSKLVLREVGGYLQQEKSFNLKY